MSVFTKKPGFFEFTDNIIARAEFRHQRFIIENSRSGVGWIAAALVMLAPALLTSLALFVIGAMSQWSAIDQLINHENPLLQGISRIGLIAFITMNIALYIVVMLVTMGLSSTSINREISNHTWPVLVLTHVNARQIVWGKWWASLQALWGDHIMLAILRLGIAGWLIVIYWRDIPSGQFGLPPGATHVAAMTILLVAFTVIDAMFTTAMGVAIPLTTLPGSIIVTLVFGIRAVATVSALWFANEIKNAMVHGRPYMVLALFGLGCFLFATWLALKIAEYIAIRGQVTAR